MIKFVKDCLQIVPGNLKDYKALSRYHYCTEPIRPVTHFFKIIAKAPYTNSFPNPIGILVFKPPLPSLSGRNKAMGDFFLKSNDRSKRMKLVNKHIAYASRMIIDPRFKGSGLALYLLKHCLPLIDKPIIEALSRIDFTNNLLIKAGFQVFYTPEPKRYTRLKKAFSSIGLSNDSFNCPLVVDRRLEALKTSSSKFIKNEIAVFLNGYGRRKNMPPGLERTKFILSKINYPRAYFIYRAKNFLDKS